MAGYFENFPLIRYGSTYARNILTRVAFTNEVLRDKFVYYPYEQKTDIRPEYFAHLYYDDSFSDWVLFHANVIIDPYYQWYLSNEQVSSLIEKKYGSLTKAASMVHHWEVNWLGDETILSPALYGSLTVDPSIGVNQKKYWTPLYNDNDMIVGYKRKELDARVCTNRLVSLSFGETVPQFTVGEKVYQLSGSTISGYGFACYSSTTSVVVNNIFGTLVEGEDLIGEDSGAVGEVTDITTLQSSIPPLESQYWRPVSVYDYEIENNEKNRSINVIDRTHIRDVNQVLRQTLL